MSAIDQRTTDQAEKKNSAKTAEAKPAAAKATKKEEVRPAVKEANAPRSSLLDLYFGEGARKVTATRSENVAERQPSRMPPERRSTPVRPPTEKRPSAEAVRPAAPTEVTHTPRPTRPEGPRSGAEAARPVAERSARPSNAQGAAAARPAAAAEREIVAPAVPGASAPQDQAVPFQPPQQPAAEPQAVEQAAPVAEKPAAGAPEAAAETTAAEATAAEATAAETTAAETTAAETAAEEAPTPAAEAPVRPQIPRGPRAEMQAVERPAGPAAFAPRAAGPAAPPQQRILHDNQAARPPLGPGAGRVIGAPKAMVQAQQAASTPPPASGVILGMPKADRERLANRPPMSDRPRPMGPAADRGPRPAGPGRGGPRGVGRPLAIPKVDPKIAEQKQETKRPGQNKVVKEKSVVDETLDRRDRPPEEKLFGRRAPGRGATVERRTAKQSITIEGAVIVKELAHEMGVTAAEVIKKLLKMGMLVTINQELDTDTASIVAAEFGVTVVIKEPEFKLDPDMIEDADEVAELKQSRPPVVVIMGHVDHGKTSLLDAMRETRVAAGEAGGITQHIGAYQIELHGKKITFLDTPGHEAFTAMRARGASVTDIAVLVVAADDGVMPQTVEAINHAKAAGVPIIVAINKIDKAGADPGRVKTELTEHHLVVEEWGGDVIAVPVSAKQRTNLDLLLENILLVAEVQELKANPDKEARGTILEAQLDKGKGPVGTVLVQGGTLQTGEPFVCGTTWGKVRTLFDDRGRKVKKAPPSFPVQVVGFNAVPEAGDIFRVVADEKMARELAERRATAKRLQEQQQVRVSLEEFMARSAAGEVKDLNIIVKGDVMGSVEAVRGALEKVENAEARVKVIHGAVGAVTESDVMLAAASKAIIIGFNVRPDDRAVNAARQQNVEIKTYRIIYEAVDDIKAALQGMLKPKFEEIILGKAKIQAVFKVPKIGNVAGCQVIDGKLERRHKARLIRDGSVLWEGDLSSLKRFKDDVREVTNGQECGIGLEGYNDIKENDVIESFTMQEIKPEGA